MENFILEKEDCHNWSKLELSAIETDSLTDFRTRSEGATGLLPSCVDNRKSVCQFVVFLTKMSSPATSNLLQDKIALLPKHAKGLAVVHLIKEVLEHPLIFVYGELKDAPQVSFIFMLLQSFH